MSVAVVDGNEPNNKCSTAVAEKVASDNDLLTEILIRLPVTSLLQFKSVSKRWLSIISDPYFARIHSPHNPPSISGLFLNKFSWKINPEFEFISLRTNSQTPPFRSLTFHPDPSGIKILQSCNGLLCCSSFRSEPSRETCYIYNPATNQYTTLPPPPAIGRTSIRSINLVVNFLNSPHYKVVCMSCIDTISDDYRIGVEMYSSQTASWRCLEVKFNACFEVCYKSGVFWNGALHWVSETEPCLYLFHIDSEILQTKPMPPAPEGWEQRRVEYYGAPRDDERRKIEYFGASGGHMHLIERYEHCSHLNIFEMESDYSCWNVKYDIDLDALSIMYPEMIRDHLNVSDLHHFAFTVLLVQGEEEFLSSLPLAILHLPGLIISYDLRSNTFKKLRDLTPPDHLKHLDVGPCLQYQRSDSYQYIETLACV